MNGSTGLAPACTAGSCPAIRKGNRSGHQMDWVYGRMQRLTDKPFIVCEFGTIDDSNQVGVDKRCPLRPFGWPLAESHRVFMVERRL